MRVSAMTFVRLVFLAALGTTVLAIQLGRLAPLPRNQRTPRPGRVVGLSGLFFDSTDDRTRFLDAATGEIRRLPLPPGHYLDDAVCSPWQDEHGISHVIGRWRKAEGPRGRVVMTELGVGCFAYPTGEELARVPCDVLPQGGGCWYPGTADRVLFTAANGTLYHVSFEPGPEGAASESAPNRPRRIRWAIPPPGDDVMVREPFWPSVPGFEHTVLVSLRTLSLEPGIEGYTNAQLWWLRLDAEGTAVVAAGRLTEPDQEDRDECQPCVAATPGGLAVAYLTNGTHEIERRLEFAPVAFDPKTGAPRADLTRAVVLAEHCFNTPVAFSPGGRRVAALVRTGDAAPRVQWFRVPRPWPPIAAPSGTPAS